MRRFAIYFTIALCSVVALPLIVGAQQTVSGYNITFTFTPSVCPGQQTAKQRISFGTNVPANEAGDIKLGLITLCQTMQMVPLPCKGANPVACGTDIVPVTIP